MDCFKILRDNLQEPTLFYSMRTPSGKNHSLTLNITHFDWKLVFQPLSGRVHVNLG